MRSITYLLLLALLAVPAHGGRKLKYIRVGSQNDVSTRTTAGTVLMGGGDDVDAAFQWMCERSGNGDFLVISAKGKAEYNPYIQKLCPHQNSAATLILPSREAANDPQAAAIIEHAEALFIEGGDQASYIKFWQGTPVQSAIQGLINRGAPIGGTSAGMNLLAQFIYTGACRKTVPSKLAKANPFDKCLAFAENFVSIPALKDRIDDPHFITRDRMGRDLAFLCRVYNNGWAVAPRDITVDDQTALLVESNGDVKLVGKSNAYFLSAPGPPEVCQAGTPVTYQNVAVYRITPSTGTFNVSTWSGTGGTSYSVSATAGVMSSTQAGGSLY
jgi:cyanophycinase-like exopeptidase